MQHRNHKGANTFSWHWTDILTYQLINRLTYSFRNGKGSRQYVICEHNIELCVSELEVGGNGRNFSLRFRKTPRSNYFVYGFDSLGSWMSRKLSQGDACGQVGIELYPWTGLEVIYLHGWKYCKVNKGCKTWEQVIKCVRTDRMGSVPTRLSLPICALSLIGYSLGCCQPFAQSQLWWVPASCEPWQDKKMDRWIFTS